MRRSPDIITCAPPRPQLVRPRLAGPARRRWARELAQGLAAVSSAGAAAYGLFVTDILLLAAPAALITAVLGLAFLEFLIREPKQA